MGKKSLPKCGTCEPVCPYQAKCSIPYEPCPSTDGMYINIGNGEKYCKSVFISNKFTTITNSLYNFKGTVGVNSGIPTAVWNNATCTPFVSYPVPYYLQEMDGNTKNNNMILMSQVYDGNNSQVAVADPVLATDSNTTIIADVADRFVKGVMSIFPVTASKFDVDDNVSMFKIISKGTVKLRVTVQATRVVTAASDETMFTKVIAVDDISNPCCKIPLSFTTFRVQSLGENPVPSEVDPVEDYAPVYMTFVKNSCCEFSVGFFHGLAADVPAGQVYPAVDAEDPIEYEWPDYTMVGAMGDGCPLNEPNQLTSLYCGVLADQIFSMEGALNSSTVATLKLLDSMDAEVQPGNLTSAEKMSLVNSASESLVNMWRQGVNAFNAFIVDITV